MDNRVWGKKFISYSQKRKFLLLKVDQELSTKHTIAKELSTILTADTARNRGYLLEVKHLLIERYTGRIFDPYVLESDIPVRHINGTDTSYIGTLSYNVGFKPRKNKTPKTEICEEMLTIWHRNLKLDLLELEGHLGFEKKAPDRLLHYPLKRPYNLQITTSSVLGLNFWQVEGELFFTRPETRKSYWFNSNIIRYQYNPYFEMVAYGKKSEHYVKRLNRQWLFDVTSNVLVGLNRWHNDTDITLYQTFNLSLSSSQTINFNKKNKSGLTFNAGFFENLYYVVKLPIRFQVGIKCGLGYNF